MDIVPRSSIDLVTSSAAHLALAGASLIVTRPVGNGASLKRRITALGGYALSLPGNSLRATLATPALRAQLAAAYDADRVIFSSPAAVRFAFMLCPAMRFARNTHVLGVGSATGRALLRRGVTNVLTPAQQTSEGILSLPQLKNLRGLRVALINAPGGRKLLPQTLRRRGAQLVHIAVYQRLPPRLNQRHFSLLERASRPCLLLLSSVQALRNLCQVLPISTLTQLRQVEVIASSARIAIAAREHGFAAITLACSANNDDLLAAAIGAVGRHRL